MDLTSLSEQAIAFARTHQGAIPYIAFAIGLAKSLAIVSLLIPGVVILVALGAILGASGLPLWPAVLADATGASLGYALSFWAGRYWSRALLDWPPLARHGKAIARSEAFFARYGTASVFLGHFFGPVRAFIALVAGIARMRELPFQLANVTSALLWSFGVLAPSYYGLSSGLLDATWRWAKSLV